MNRKGNKQMMDMWDGGKLDRETESIKNEGGMKKGEGGMIKRELKL